MTEKTDEQLIAEHDRGDENAFDSLVRRHLKTVYRLSFRIAGKEAAEDIVQETFLKVWKKFSSFRRSGNFKAWLLGIARNAAIDHLRKQKYPAYSEISESSASTPEEFLLDDKPLQDEILDRAKTSEALVKVITKLPIRDREILSLHYENDLTFDEIGKILGRPLHTVKSLHHRALIALRKILSSKK